MKASRQLKREIVKQPHKFKVDDMVTVRGIPDRVFQVRQCLYDSCGHSIYRFYGYFGEPIHEDRITLKKEQ